MATHRFREEVAMARRSKQIIKQRCRLTRKKKLSTKALPKSLIFLFCLASWSPNVIDLSNDIGKPKSESFLPVPQKPKPKKANVKKVRTRTGHRDAKRDTNRDVKKSSDKLRGKTRIKVLPRSRFSARHKSMDASMVMRNMVKLWFVTSEDGVLIRDSPHRYPKHTPLLQL
eukprot:180961-Amorphochlora_amoeboformis.AAC.1